MVLSYKNFSTSELLNQTRNINYANIELLYGINNIIDLQFQLEIDIIQLQQQADVFSRQLLIHKSSFDFKRALGPYTADWPRLLHEAYVYDRCKCIFYGINSVNMSEFPKNSHSFPGNVLLMHMLKERTFSFTTGDSQPYHVNLSITNAQLAMDLLQPVLDEYPDINSGISSQMNTYVYQNTIFEGILSALSDAKVYMDTKRNATAKGLFEIVPMNDDKIPAFLLSDANPLANSFLNKERDKYYFILPSNDSSSEVLRHNESMFITRALGLISQQYYLSGNPLYRIAERRENEDPMTCNEMYSVTGLKSDLTPYGHIEVLKYLGINTLGSLSTMGGNNPDVP